MKKTMLFLVLFLLLLSVIGCGSPDASSEGTPAPEVQATTPAETAAPKVVEDNTEKWFIARQVDAFGDEVSNSNLVMIKTSVKGTFTNSVTQNSPLVVDAVDIVGGCIKGGLHAFSFQLKEYDGSVLASIFSSSAASMKIKVGDTILDYPLDAQEGTGTVYLGMQNAKGDELFNFLYQGYDVRCIITIDHTQYNFTLPAEGFVQVVEQAQEKWDEIIERNRIKNVAMVVNAFMNESKELEAYLMLKDNVETYHLLSEEEIKAELKGDFFCFLMNRVKVKGQEVNAVNTYWTVQTFSDATMTQIRYFANKKNTIKPEITNFAYAFILENGLIKFPKLNEEYQVRRLGEGYYCLYMDADSQYTTPHYLLMKGEETASGFVASNPLPED